jgi:hypothetical protein
VDLLPFLKGERRGDPHEALCWRWRAEQAIRAGDWKLVRGREQREWRLIDLSKDIRESNDLASQHPDKAAELRAIYERWTNGLPPVGPSYRDTTEGDDGDADRPRGRDTN